MLVLLAAALPAAALAQELSAGLPAPVSNPEPLKLIRMPTVRAAGLLASGNQTIVLSGVSATSLEQRCGSGLEAWPCGRVARTALQSLIRGRTVECQFSEPTNPSANTAHCRLGSKDIGEWLVSQGWAKANGPEYAQSEKAAGEAKLGLWSPTRPGPAADPAFIIGTTLTDAPVRVEVSLASQSLTLTHRGMIIGQWPVSTARDGKETPTGIWTAKWLSRDHRSKLYDDAPMPYAVFYDGDYAIHGTHQTGRLGRPASHGCVRLDTKNAATLFRLVEQEGLGNTLVVIRP